MKTDLSEVATLVERATTFNLKGHIDLVEFYLKGLSGKKSTLERALSLQKFLKEEKYKDPTIPNWKIIQNTPESVILSLYPEEPDQFIPRPCLYDFLCGEKAIVTVTCEFVQTVTLIKIQDWRNCQLIYLKDVPYKGK